MLVYNFTRIIFNKFFFSYLTVNFFVKLNGQGWDYLSAPHFPIYSCFFMEGIYLYIYFQHIYLYLLWLNEYPSEFKPLIQMDIQMDIQRYFDDSFLLFKSEDQITHFQNYLNSKHPNIKFIVHVKLIVIQLFQIVWQHEKTTNLKLHRKETFTRLGSGYFSFTPYIF